MKLDKFFEIVDSIPPDENGCKIWNKYKFSDGYCGVHVGNKLYRGHRLVLSRKLGRELGEGMQACHTCDVPACVNPDHLWEGTHYENHQDRKNKGRAGGMFHPLWGKHHKEETIRKISAAHTGSKKPWLNGEGNPQSKLKIDTVKQIKQRLLIGESITAIARSFGIPYSTVNNIKRQDTWREV